jgi:hypothetical protein
MSDVARQALALLVLLAALFATGCTSGSVDAPSSTAAGPATAAPSGDLPLPSLDVERQTALLADGLEAGEAEFLALTSMVSEVIDDHTYRVVATFPTGDEAELIVTLQPDQVGDPEAIEFSHELVGDDFRFRLGYLVPWDVIPADLHDDIRAGGTALIVDAVLAMAPTTVAADSNGVGVIVTGLVKQLYGQASSETARIIDERFQGRLDVSTTLRMLRALEGVGNALASSADYQDIVRELDAIEKCARNPTNPITQRAYRDDPALLERVLDQISATRAEVKANAAALYLSHLIKTGSSLIRNVPALGFIVGPGTAWSKQALNQVTRKLIDDLRKNVPACGQDYQIDKTVNVTQMNVTVAVSYTATKCDGPFGEWTIESSGTLSGYGGTAAIGGPIVVNIPPNSSQGTLEGTANFDDENQGHTEGHFFGGAQFVEEPPTLELTVTSGSGSGYSWGFLDTGFMGPGTLTFPLEQGDFCD